MLLFGTAEKENEVQQNIVIRRKVFVFILLPLIKWLIHLISFAAIC